MDSAYDRQRERLFDAPCRVIDFLPRQVPAESGDLYFPVEAYCMAHPRIDALYARFARVLLKLSCYYAPAVNLPPEERWRRPEPETLVALTEGCAGEGERGSLSVLFPREDALLTLERGDLYLSLYGGTPELLETAEQLARSEGLFFRPAAD